MKRSFLLFSFAMAAWTTLGLSADRPNVVILLSDDLGFKDIGCYDGPVKTPALDSLAARGTRFSDFYSGCAVCSPSRATLLTGRNHIRAGVYSWIENNKQRSHLLEREVTIAEILKGAGYQTAHFGKWHLGLPTPERAKPSPAEHGFDYWFATDNNAGGGSENDRAMDNLRIIAGAASDDVAIGALLSGVNPGPLTRLSSQ